MRTIVSIAAGILMAGCAAHPVAITQPLPPESVAADDGAGTACALVFPAPVQAPYPLDGLARASRQPSAFLGYDEQISEIYAVSTDDEQGDYGWSDGYQRSSVTARVGIRYR